MPCTETVQGIFCFSEEKPQKSAAAEPEPKLGERRPNMLFDGLDADVEPLGDLPVFLGLSCGSTGTPGGTARKVPKCSSRSPRSTAITGTPLRYGRRQAYEYRHPTRPVRIPPPPFFGAQQIYGTILHGDKQQRQQRPVEVHLLPPFPQGKKDILHDVFRALRSWTI